MKNQFRLTIAEYKAYCESFFANMGKEQLEKLIASFTVEQFQEWQNDINKKYYEYYGPIRELVSLIRGDYDPLKDYNDNDDPLQEEENHAVFVQYRDVYNNVYDDYIESLPAFIQKMQELQKFREAEELERLLTIEVEGRSFKALKVISVYWSGWECDQYAWVVQDGDTTRLVASNHGSLSFIEKSFLEKKIEEYKTAISDSQDMLNML